MAVNYSVTSDYSHYALQARRRREAVIESLAEILLKNMSKWRDELDAYWFLRRFEDEVDYPITYDIVEEAVALARRYYSSISVSRREAVEEAV